jgi:hypothetical protein
MQSWANTVNLEIDYSGVDIYLIYNGKFVKVPISTFRRISKILIEQIVR